MPSVAAAIPPTSNTMWYVTLTLLAVTMLSGLVWAFRVWQDVRGETEEHGDSPRDLLGPLEEAYAAGQMNEDEYYRIRESVLRVAGGEERDLPLAVPNRPKVRDSEPTDPAHPEPSGDPGAH